MVLSRGAAAAAVAALAVAGAAASGCKGGVIPPDTFAQPWRLQAQLAGALPDGGRPVVGVVWTDPLERAADVLMPARRIGSTVGAAAAAAAGAAGPVTFEVSLHGPPPAEALAEIPSPAGDTAVMAMGELVIVDDADGDGTFRIDRRGTIAAPAGDGGGGGTAAGDRYLASSQTMIIYVARPFARTPPADFKIAPFSQAGYHLQAFTCLGRLFVAPKNPANLPPVVFEAQTSRTLVDRRTCLRTHTP